MSRSNHFINTYIGGFCDRYCMQQSVSWYYPTRCLFLNIAYMSIRLWAYIPMWGWRYYGGEGDGQDMAILSVSAPEFCFSLWRAVLWPTFTELKLCQPTNSTLVVPRQYGTANCNHCTRCTSPHQATPCPGCSII